MSNNIGTLVTSPIRPQGTADTYPSAYAQELLGGHMSVALITDLTGIPSDRRVEGMTCWVAENNTLYVLQGGILDADWTVFTAPSSSTAAYNVSFTGVAAGQSVTLPAAPSASPLMLLIIQGLVENPAEYSISGTTLVIPAGLVWDGAQCQFVFS